jgi:hypothetical protein
MKSLSVICSTNLISWQKSDLQENVAQIHSQRQNGRKTLVVNQAFSRINLGT